MVQTGLTGITEQVFNYEFMSAGGLEKKQRGFFLGGDVLREMGLVDSDQRAPSPTYGPKGTVSVQV